MKKLSPLNSFLHNQEECIKKIINDADIIEKIVKTLNNIISARIVKYKNVTGHDVYTHFMYHIDTDECLINRNIERYSLITEEIFKNGGIVKQSLTKTSKLTGQPKRKVYEKPLMLYDKLIKTQLELIKASIESKRFKINQGQKK